MSLASRSRLIAVALMISAIAAPVASAQPDPAASGTGQSQTTTAAPAVRPNPDRQATQSVPVGPPILRRARASEQAAISRAQAGEAQALSYSLPPTAGYSSAELNAYASANHPVAAATNPSETYPAAGPNPDGQTPVDAPATIVRVSTPSSGFDWGDAGIGAAGGLALSMLGLAGALMLSQRRERRSSRSAALTR